MLTRRAFVAAAAAGLLAAPSVWAQQRRVPRIALLSINRYGDYRHQAFLEGLRAFGYVENQTIFIDYYFAERPEQISDLAKKAVAQSPDVIVAHATPSVLAAMSATTTIPIVLQGAADPLAFGIFQSLARPTGNVTGLSQMGSDIAAKRLQMLQQFVPGLARVAVIHNPDNVGGKPALAQIEIAGPILKLDVRPVPARGTDDIDSIFANLRADGIQAIITSPDTTYVTYAEKIGRAALAHRFPTMTDFQMQVAGGALISYGVNLIDHFRRGGYYVDRILKGAKPQDLPVEQPMLFDLVINRKTANALGLEIPLGLLVQATEVIE
jgi:putative tryptophan/tyrosine transport system substrate-binding protein